jgi:hypothetical protein
MFGTVSSMIAAVAGLAAGHPVHAVQPRMIGGRNSVPISRKACVLSEDATCHSV